jgi:hypothetical protein
MKLTPEQKRVLGTWEMEHMTATLLRIDQSLTGKDDAHVEHTLWQQAHRFVAFAFGEGDGDSQMYYLSDDGLSRLFIDPDTGKLHVASVSTPRVKWLFEYESGLRLQVERAAAAARSQQ